MPDTFGHQGLITKTDVKPGLKFTIRCEVDRESMVSKDRWLIDNELGIDIYLFSSEIVQAVNKTVGG